MGDRLMRIVYITRVNFSNNQSSGGKKCSFRNFEILKAIAGPENVYVCILTPEDLPVTVQGNLKIFQTKENSWLTLKNYIALRDCYSKANERELVAYVEELQPDLIFFDGSQLGALGRRFDASVPIVCFLHNIERKYTWNRVTQESPKFIIQYYNHSRNEKYIVKHAKRIICLNERDGLLLRQIYRRNCDLTIPITFEDQFDPERAKAELIGQDGFLLFVGSYFRPNYVGIRWFVENVMPSVQKKLLIVGNGMEKVAAELTRENVEVLGAVDDLAPYYYEADAMVMPIPYGDGMKVKTAEAMMYGKAILGSEEAFEGYKYKGISGLMLCISAMEYIAAIQSLEQKFCKYNESVRNLFLEKYETNHYIAQVKNMLEELV